MTALGAKIVSLPAPYQAAAGVLGESYTVVLPIVGAKEVEVPVEAIVHDAISAARDDLKQRTIDNWPVLAGIGLAAAAVVLLIKARRS